MSKAEERCLIADTITARFSRLGSPYIFRVGEPCRLTWGVTTKGSVKYQTASFIGGEVFVGRTAYVGKRGAVILVFWPRDENKNVRVECDLVHACRYIDGFDTFMDGVYAEIDEINMRAAKMEGESLEIVADKDGRRDKYKEDPLFGSW
mgnify:CR=1 FL=1